MSAIGAIFERDGAPVSKDDADRMAASLRVHGQHRQHHRRFDMFAACWAQSGIFVPEDRFDQQPMATKEGAFLFCGRLHYRADLEEALGLDASRVKTMADSALAKAAWEKWGRDCLDWLEGHWNFIAFDCEEQRLFAARSPITSPPLVYHEAPGRFAIASAPKGLFALSTIEREVDEQRVADSLILNFEELERTFFKGIRLLPSGHWLEVRQDRIETCRYYDPDNLEPVRFAKDSDYIEALDEHMRRAMHSYMRAETTPACSLSAGLDSSTVAVYALEALGRGEHGLTDPLLGFTHVPGKDWDGRTYGKGGLGDESGPVKALMAMYPQLDVRFVASEGLSLDHRLDDVIRFGEMPPIGWNNLHWGAEISRQIRAAGRNIMLNGSSGNSTISFSHRFFYPQLFKQGRLKQLHREMRKLPTDEGLLARYYRRVFWHLLPEGMVNAISRLRGTDTSSAFARSSAINPEYAADMDVASRAEEMALNIDIRTVKSAHDLRKLYVFNSAREQSALVQSAMLAADGMEARDPLGCRRITEFCFAIPDEQLMRGGTDRWLARRLMKDRLPPEIVDMRGRGRQSADWHARFTKDLGRYREEFERAADDPEMAARFDIPRIRAVLDSWPDKTPLNAEDHPDYMLAMVGIGRMITTSRFINWVNGKN